MADGDWSDDPREVIPLDTFGQQEMADTGSWDWDHSTLAVTIDPFGQQDVTASFGYAPTTIAVTLDPFAVIESGTAGYPGDANGYIVIPLEFQTLPELQGVTSAKSIQIIPLNGLELPIEYWS